LFDRAKQKIEERFQNCDNGNKPAPGKLKWNTRHTVQLAVFLLTLAIGIQFAVYVFQAFGNGMITVQRPPGVEGFLPIGALMGWKLFLTTGIWDPIHPAAMVIIGFAGLVSLVLRKSFCGWFCPVGALSEWLWKLGRHILGKNYRLFPWLDFPLRSLKYLLLGFFVWVIASMPENAIYDFIFGAYYKLSDVKMLFFFTRMSLVTAIVLFFLLSASLFIRNFWCRYLCPYGALMGLFALISPTRIERKSETCIGCGQCRDTCPHQLKVDNKEKILSPECSGCMDCTKICPVENTLKMKTIGPIKRAWSTVSVGIVIVCLFTLLVFSARITGHWQTRLPRQEFRALLQQIDSPHIQHPKVLFMKK
jgi:polyferredoxin